jgi:hypothetical protein
MPVETFHLIIGLLFVAVWALAAAVRFGHHDAKSHGHNTADRW